MKFKLLSFLLCCMASSNLSLGQTQATGKVIDSADKQPIISATIILNNTTDTTKKFSVASGADGNFSFSDLKSGKYQVSIMFLGYKTLRKNITIQDQSKISLGTFAIAEDSRTLQGVTVEGKTQEVVVKTDTLEFSTKNIPTRENAVVEDILKKIPGVDVDKSGAITAQGEKVTKVRVDGKDFFTGDPTMATRNIPADVIDKIQIIDNLSEQSQFSGVDDGSREKIINITTKSGMSQGEFGLFNVSKGDIGRYSVNGNYNKFNKDSRFSVVADFNNINKKNFTGDNSSQSGFQRALPSLAGLSNPGIETVSSFGVNYDSELDKDTKLHANYSFDKTNLNLIQNSVVQNLAANNTATNTIDATNLNNNIRHRFNSRFEHNIDSLTSLRMVTDIGFTNNEARNLQNYINVFNQGASVSKGNQSVNQNNSTPSFSNDLLLRHKFKKKGRNISLSMNTDISDGKLGIYNINDVANEFIADSTLSSQSVTNQYNDQLNKSFSNTIRLVYTEPIMKNLFLELNATNRYNNSDVKRYVFDYDMNTLRYDQLNDSLTNVYNNRFYTNSGGASINYNNKIINWNVGLAVQHTDLLSDNISRNRNFYQEQLNYLPTAMFQYRLNKTKRIRFNYRGTTTQPSVDQIAPITDNTNALNVRIGNADLKQSFTHNLRLNFNTFNTKSEIMFFSFIGFTSTQNAISNRIYIDDIGRTVQQTVNVDGVYGGNGFASFSFPLIKKKLRFTVSALGNYNKGVSYLKEALNIANNYSVNNGYKLMYNTEKLDVTIGGSMILNKATYSAQSSSNTRFLTTNANIDFGYMLPGNVRMAMDLNYYNNTGRGAGFDRDYVMLNGYVSKQLLKSKQLTVRLSVNDAFKNNLGISRTVSNFSITDLKYNVLQRYYLLTLTYSLKNFAGKNMADARNRMGGEGEDRGFGGGRGRPF